MQSIGQETRQRLVRRRPGRAHSSHSFRAEGLFGLVLGEAPRGVGAVYELTASDSHTERLRTGVALIFEVLNPALAVQDAQVTAQGRGVEVEQATELRWPGSLLHSCGDQDVELADFHTEGPQGFVVEVRDDPIETPDSDSEAVVRDLSFDGHKSMVYTSS